MLPDALFGLTAFHQFIVYRLVPGRVLGKMDKLPCDYRSGEVSNAHNPAIWTDSLTAQATASQWGDGWGVGFVFTEQDPFWFLDIDSALIDGQWSPLAVSLCQLFTGAAMEVSSSGKGLHIFGTGKPPAHACTNKALGLEFYDSGRFVALTGINAVGNCFADMSAVLPALVAQYFQADEPAGIAQGWSDGPVDEWRGPSDDVELIRRAINSRSTAGAFSGKASFADLWLADEKALALTYPDPIRAYDESAADAALAQHLAFWTGCDCERISRLMQGSKLVRDKWEREDYLPRTIMGAVGRQAEVLQDKPAPEPPVSASVPAAPAASVAPGAMAPRSGDPYVNDISAYFAGCTYIQGYHRALLPNGVIVKPDAFNVIYGGRFFRLDAEKVTEDAWKAWTQSRTHACVRAHGTTFKPALPFGQIVNINGHDYVNTFMPIEIDRKQGNPAPFLNHLAKVLPDERDRTILLSYMAACVQHQGVKFQWAPLLQGVEGNGKTLFARCVEKAVGTRYTHWPKASQLASQFNAWMVGKVFYAVEDIYVSDSKREILEELKPMITGGSFEIQAKGVDQVSADICGNFMFNSNHRDAIRKTNNDRRFCVFYSAQQAADDLASSGMAGNYFPNLYEWLNGDGYAIVSEFLFSYSIPAEFNPAGSCQRAPITTSTHEAIAASLGNVEQEILEAIAQGMQGFCGGWISSIWLDRLLERLGLRKISHRKRKEILEEMGYMRHPALVDGRTANTVIPDNAKATLYIKRDSLVAQISYGLEATKNYEAANRNAQNLPFSRVG